MRIVTIVAALLASASVALTAWWVYAAPPAHHVIAEAYAVGPIADANLPAVAIEGQSLQIVCLQPDAYPGANSNVGR